MKVSIVVGDIRNHAGTHPLKSTLNPSVFNDLEMMETAVCS